MKKNWIDFALFYASALFVFIGIHQAIKVGYAESYFFFATSVFCFLTYVYRKGLIKMAASEPQAKPNQIKGKKK